MALFKILRGTSSDFTTDLTQSSVTPPFKDGYCYFLTDTKLFYIDCVIGGINSRVPLNAENANLLDNTELSTLVDIIDNHVHQVSHTPAGSITKTSIIPAGSVTSTFTGTEVTSIGPSKTETVASSTHIHKYTPTGTVSKPTFTGDEVTSSQPTGTTSIYSITGVGSVPSLTSAVNNRCLTFTFGAGSVPTRSSINLPSTTHTHDITATGSVSQPTFTGTEGSTTSITGTVNVGSSDHTHKVTATGSVSSTFKGTAAEHNHTFNGTEATVTSSSAIK